MQTVGIGLLQWHHGGHQWQQHNDIHKCHNILIYQTSTWWVGQDYLQPLESARRGFVGDNVNDHASMRCSARAWFLQIQHQERQ